MKHTFFLAIICSLFCGFFSLDAANSSSNNSPAVLYYSNTCPHCHTVIDYLNRNNKSVTMKNISTPEYREELRAYGHKGVPVLVDGSKIVPGSSRIIDYLSSKQ